MMPVEWPIAAPGREAEAPAHAASRDRLRTVRVDFFLKPEDRLSEQERALMTAMLHCLVGDIASSLRASAARRSSGANNDDTGVVATLARAGLLDDPDLIALILQRADEERIASAARARSGRREGRALQALVSHHDAEVSAAAMGLILARGRRRNGLGQCLAGFDDLRRPSAERLVNAIAAALHLGSGPGDSEMAAAAADLVGRHDPQKSVEALTESLARQLAEADALDDDILLAWAQEGEVGLIAASAAVRADIAVAVALEELLSRDGARITRLMNLAEFRRSLAAGIFASIGDLLGIDAGAAIVEFDALNDADRVRARHWLSASHSYRAALHILGGADG